MELEAAVIREMQRWTMFRFKEGLVNKQVLIAYRHLSVMTPYHPPLHCQSKINVSTKFF